MFAQTRKIAVKYGSKVLVAGAAAASSVSAFAAGAVDYSTLATGVSAEVTSGITAALPVGAAVLGAVIGFHVFKRFVKG